MDIGDERKAYCNVCIHLDLHNKKAFPSVVLRDGEVMVQLRYLLFEFQCRVMRMGMF